MWNKKKRKALLVLAIATILSVVIFLTILTAGYFAIPLFVAVVFIIVGMIAKWAIEWVILNFKKLKVGEKAQAVKEKLKIDKGIDLVKESIDVLKEKDDKDE